MKNQGVSFEEVYDKYAIRIILDSKLEQEKADCWKAYSLVTENFSPNPLRLRDWISSRRVTVMKVYIRLLWGLTDIG